MAVPKKAIIKFMIHDAIFSATDDSPSENDSPNIWHQLTSNLAKAFTFYIFLFSSCLENIVYLFFLATLTHFRGFQLTDIFPATAVWGGIALKHVTLNFDKASVVCRRYGFHRLPMGVRWTWHDDSERWTGIEKPGECAVFFIFFLGGLSKQLAQLETC